MCKVTEEIFQKNLEIGRAERAKNNKWLNSKYEEVKTWDNTDKGNLGERHTSDMLNTLDYVSTIINRGIGTFDILLEASKATVKIEHKLATEDTHGSFQFNGIKKYIDYDYVFCMGISPNDLCFTIISRKEAQARLTTLMSSGVKGVYKYSVPKKRMMEYTQEKFKEEIEKIVK